MKLLLAVKDFMGIVLVAAVRARGGNIFNTYNILQ